MSEKQRKAYLIAAAMAILHNGKRYEQGDKIELTDEEAEKISLYIALDDTEVERQQAEAEAEKQRLAAEKAAEEAAEKAAQEAAEKEAKAKAEAEKKAQETAKKRGQADKDVQDNKDKDEQ
ncbi:hypothetical protein ADJ80_03815 [Aggregatibacter aphrophilus]|jgi:erp22-like protein|uniref:DUF7210 family protein n=1 Tax=Aggregatibacter aphrophilus TaxID=732 RepID=UPI000682DFE2|nr:hypothetical protein [Aggregatibacter aphrophilus]AKU62939.1 hypothetical protein ADJ80_03815 [Aggregatibacter aphrophilus]DAO44594.1 MAG TPA: hypothetical protein [Caudoviricetes sp.]